MKRLHWIQTSTGKWHAWSAGKTATMCNRIDADDLRKYPAQRISVELPQDQDVCVLCAKRTGITSCSMDPITSAWIVVIRMHLSHIHARLHDKLIIQMAQRLGEVGMPNSYEGKQVFDEIKFLLLRPLRESRRSVTGHCRTISTFPHLKDALEKIPNAQALQQVALAIRAWRNLASSDPSTQRFRPDRVIDTILQIPEPDPYIRHLKARGLHALAAIFHPNTLERAKKDPALRGLFSGSSDYWNATASQLNVITE